MFNVFGLMFSEDLVASQQDQIRKLEGECSDLRDKVPLVICTRYPYVGLRRLLLVVKVFKEGNEGGDEWYFGRKGVWGID